MKNSRCSHRPCLRAGIERGGPSCDGLIFNPEIMDAVEYLESFGEDRFRWNLSVIHGGLDKDGRPSLTDNMNAFVCARRVVFVCTAMLNMCGTKTLWLLCSPRNGPRHPSPCC